MPLNPNGAHYYSWLENVISRPKVGSGELFMARIIDVYKCLQGLPVTCIGELQLCINDKYCPWNNRTFKIWSEGHKLSLESINEKQSSPNLTIDGLTALVYGILPVKEIETSQWLKCATNVERKLLDVWFPEKTP